MKHIISVKRRSNDRVGSYAKPSYSTRCNCGWSSPERDDRFAAIDDGKQHTKETENE